MILNKNNNLVADVLNFDNYFEFNISFKYGQRKSIGGPENRFHSQ